MPLIRTPSLQQIGADVRRFGGQVQGALTKPITPFATLRLGTQRTSVLPVPVQNAIQSTYQRYLSATSFTFGKVPAPNPNSILGSLNLGLGAALIVIPGGGPEGAMSDAAGAVDAARGSGLAELLAENAARDPGEGASLTKGLAGISASDKALQGVLDARAGLTAAGQTLKASALSGLAIAAKYGIPIAGIGLAIGYVAPFAGLGLGQAFANVGYGVGAGLYNIGAGLTGGAAAGTSGGYGQSGGSSTTSPSSNPLGSPIVLLLILGVGLFAVYEFSKGSGSKSSGSSSGSAS